MPTPPLTLPPRTVEQALRRHEWQTNGQGISHDEARHQAWAAFGYTPEQRTRMATACHPASHEGTGHPASLLPAVGHAPSNHTA